MKANAIIFIFMLLIVVPSIVKTEMCTCPSGYWYREPDSTACLRAALQAKLTSTPTYIQELQNLFYFSNNVQSFLMNTNMTVNVSCESTEVGQLCNSSIHQFSWTHRWYEDNFVSEMKELIKARLFTNAIVSYLQTAPSFDSKVQQTFYIHLNCVYRGEPLPIVNERRMREIWEGILLWSKAYARAGGPVPAPSDSDKGRVSYKNCFMQPDANFSAICLALHIILNLVVGVMLMAFIPSQIMKQNVSSATSSLFWSTAIVGALCVLLVIVLTLTDYVISITWMHMDLTDHNEVVSVTITVVLLLFLLTLELIVAILRSKHSGLAVPRCMGYCCSFFCFFFFCCCCRPGGRSHSRVARALSLWFVMALLQLISSFVVPVIVTVLIYSPVLSLATLALTVSTLFGIVVLLAVLLYTCSQQNRSKRRLFCMYALILAGVLVIVFLVIYLFLLIIMQGVQVNSIPGFIGTLVPSAILSIITWFVKTKVLGKTETNQSSEQPQDENTLLLKDV